jgi:ElaB/YqjD/DUF883 family membrane-anchored ribosome-binding protein
MNAAQRLERARLSFGRAVSAQDRRDVSPEIGSVIANLTAAKTKFTGIDTTEFELRAILAKGVLAQLRKILATASEVPRPGAPSLRKQIEALVASAAEAFETIDVKVDAESAEAIIANDPFIRALDTADAAKDRASLASILAGVDIDTVMAGGSVPPPANTDGDPTVEVRMASIRPSELPPGETSGIHYVFADDQWKDPSHGTAECDVERRWFKRTA